MTVWSGRFIAAAYVELVVLVSILVPEVDDSTAKVVSGNPSMFEALAI
jgi:hypothetical protein